MAPDLSTKKILITGGNGQLAQAFKALFMKSGLNAVALTRADCDITDRDQFASVVENLRPGIIINCAAYNLVDDAESQPEAAFQINRNGVGNLTDICRDRKIFLVHFSTDYVFDGKKGSPYVEEDVPAPLSIYGQSKLEGERLIVDSGADHLIFRVSWLFGSGPQNFLFKLRNWLNDRNLIQVSTDEISVPTYAVDVAEYVLGSLRRGLSGLYHLPNTGSCSRYDLAQYFCSEMKIARTIQPVEQKIFALPARRPLFSAMSNAKLSKELAVSIPTWQDAVSRYCRYLRGGI
jgi:dTDP-4-dehydrorhamnose reductase